MGVISDVNWQYKMLILLIILQSACNLSQNICDKISQKVIDSSC